MSHIGWKVGPYTIAAPARIPESGLWYVAEAQPGMPTVWIRVSESDQGHEEERAVELAFERLRYLEHPAIPRALTYDKELRAMAVAAPSGRPLSDLLSHLRDPEFVMTPATVLDIGLRLSDAIVHAHERGRPHGHLSPERLWLTPEGELVLWGFGVGPDAQCEPGWWSPERARGRRASGDADQWALAAIIASLVTGRVPWPGEDPIAEARVGDASHLYGPVLTQWKVLGRLLERTLSPEPRDRFPSAHPLRQALVAMSDRVRAPSDLPRMGKDLAQRFGVQIAPAPVERGSVAALSGDSLDGADQELAGSGALTAEDLIAATPRRRAAPIARVASSEEPGPEPVAPDLIPEEADDDDVAPPVMVSWEGVDPITDEDSRPTQGREELTPRPTSVADDEASRTSPTAVPQTDGPDSTVWEDLSSEETARAASAKAARRPPVRAERLRQQPALDVVGPALADGVEADSIPVEAAITRVSGSEPLPRDVTAPDIIRIAPFVVGAMVLLLFAWMLVAAL